MQKLGVEKTKAVITLVALAVVNVQEVLEDGKISLWEIVGLTPDIKNIPKIIEMIPQVRAEFADLQSGEIFDIYAHTTKTLGLKVGSENFVREVLDFAVETYKGAALLLVDYKARLALQS